MADVDVVGSEGIVSLAVFDGLCCLVRGDIYDLCFELPCLFGDFPVCFVGLVSYCGGEVFVEGVCDVFVAVERFVEVDGDVFVLWFALV